MRFALEKGAELGELTLEELRAFGPEFGEDFFASVTLTATLDCHDVTGGTAREQVHSALDIAAKRIAAMTENKNAEAVHAGA